LRSHSAAMDRAARRREIDTRRWTTADFKCQSLGKIYEYAQDNIHRPALVRRTRLAELGSRISLEFLAQTHAVLGISEMDSSTGELSPAGSLCAHPPKGQRSLHTSRVGERLDKRAQPRLYCGASVIVLSSSASAGSDASTLAEGLGPALSRLLASVPTPR